MESEGKAAHQPFDRRSGEGRELVDADTSFEEQYVNVKQALRVQNE